MSEEVKEPKHTEAYFKEMQRLQQTHEQDRLLTVGEAAARLQTSEDFLQYR